MLLSATYLQGSLLTRGLGVRLLPPHALQDRWPAADEVLTVYRASADGVRLIDGDGDRWDAPVDLVQINLADPMTAHHAVDVLRRRGHETRTLLPGVLGGQCPEDVVAEYVPVEVARCRAEPPICEDGRVRCYGVEGHKGDHLTVPTRYHVHASALSARLLAASVMGVDADATAVQGLRGDWSEVLPGQWSRLAVIGPNDPIVYALHEQTHGRGWRCGPWRGPETGSAGRACVEAELLERGFAFLDVRAPCGVQAPYLGAK